MKSDGFFRIIDGSIKHQKMPINISNFIVDLDFAKNGLNIGNTGVIINGTPVILKGQISDNAVADISLKSGDVDIALLFNSLAPLSLKNMYVLQKGLLNIDVSVKGKLSQIEPDVKVYLKGFSFKDKINSFLLSNDLMTLNFVVKGSVWNGVIDFVNTGFRMFNPSLSLSMPDIKINITPSNIEIVPFSIVLNSSQIGLSGFVKDYIKSPKINILLDGKLLSSDLKNLLPKEMKSFVEAKGIIPVRGSVVGNLKKIDAKIQIHSDKDNHFSPLLIKKLQGQNTLLNTDISIIGDKLNFNDVSLNMSNKSVFSDDFTYNFKGAKKILGVNGVINNLYSSSPDLKLNIVMPEQVVITIPAFANASLKTKGELWVHGNILAPMFRGFLSVKEINLQDLLTKVQAVDLEFNDTSLSAKAQNLDINNSSFNIDAEVSTKFLNILLVKNIKVTCPMLDVDNLFVAMDKFMKIMPASNPAIQSNVQNTPLVPVKIANGLLDIKQIKMKQVGGDFIINNISSPFSLANDLFVLNNLKAIVYNGNINGDITYHLATTEIVADVEGKGVNANDIVTVFAALKDQVAGNVDFTADVKLKGSTYEEQVKTINGKVDFNLKDGQLGSLGRFETFLKADNLLSQSFVATSIGGLIDKIAPYNTGKYSYLDGHIDLVNGSAKLNSVKMSGPHMSLLILGDVDILTMNSNMKIMGSLSPEMVDVLGPVTNLSVEKFVAYIPKFGVNIASAMNNYNEAINKNELAKIPSLTPKKENTQSFKVLLNGNLNNPPAAIKRFQWLNTPDKMQEGEKLLNDSIKTSLPKTKEELKQQVQLEIQNQLENNAKVQEIKQNKTVKTLTGIYNFYKTNGNKSE